jgi:hypothetical protein
MIAETAGIAVSLALLCAALVVLALRGVAQYLHGGPRTQLMWGSGLALGAVAMGIETVIYLGVLDSILLQAYVLVSAAIVGVLSLGSTKVFRNARFENAYIGFVVASCALLGVFSFLTPLSSSMVSGGVISADPPLLLLILSSVVTGPATVVLIGAAVLSLRRTWKWQTLTLVAGAFVLGAGGTLYIASFPVVLYYAEFIGIGLLFTGIVSLPHPSPTSSPLARPALTGP